MVAEGNVMLIVVISPVSANYMMSEVMYYLITAELQLFDGDMVTSLLLIIVYNS